MASPLLNFKSPADQQNYADDQRAQDNSIAALEKRGSGWDQAISRINQTLAALKSGNSSSSNNKTTTTSQTTTVNRVPLHASTHAAGAPDAVSPASIGAEPDLGAPGTSGFVLASTILKVRSWVALPVVPIFVDNEVPSGLIDGLNTTYTLAGAPNPPTSLHLYMSGLRIAPGGSTYSISGNTITFTTAPVIGATLLADYRK